MADEEDLAASAPAAFADTLYPPPPSIYTRFTRKNLDLIRELLEAEGIKLNPSSNFNASSDVEKSLEWLQIDPQARIERQNRILGEIQSKRKAQDAANAEAAPGGSEIGDGEEELPDLDSDLQLDLLPPRLDWIEEEGAYFCFNERWPIQEKLAPLSSFPGLVQLYPDGPINRKATLQTLLRTLLYTFFKLSQVLKSPPRDYIATVPDPTVPPPPPESGLESATMQVWKNESVDLTESIRTTVINMQHLLNEMRPAQAIQGSKEMMKEQLKRRKDETQAIRRKCAEMRANIELMRGALSTAAPLPSEP